MSQLTHLTHPDFVRFENMIRSTPPGDPVPSAVKPMARQLITTFAKRPEGILLTTGEEEVEGLVFDCTYNKVNSQGGSGDKVESFCAVPLEPGSFLWLSRWRMTGYRYTHAISEVKRGDNWWGHQIEDETLLVGRIAKLTLENLVSTLHQGGRIELKDKCPSEVID